MGAMPRPIEDEAVVREVLPEDTGEVQLVPHPGGERPDPRLPPVGPERGEGVQDALERERRVVVMNDGGEIPLVDACLLEAVVGRTRGEAPVAGDAGEPSRGNAG